MLISAFSMLLTKYSFIQCKITAAEGHLVMKVSATPRARIPTLPQWLQIPYISIVLDCSPKYDLGVGI